MNEVQFAVETFEKYGIKTTKRERNNIKKIDITILKTKNPINKTN